MEEKVGNVFFKENEHEIQKGGIQLLPHPSTPSLILSNLVCELPTFVVSSQISGSTIIKKIGYRRLWLAQALVSLKSECASEKVQY